jgi:hypothetical protein
MRTKILGLLLAPLLLGSACDERAAIAPEDEVLAGNNLNYEGIILDAGNGNAWAINDAGIAVGTGREWGSGTPYPALRWVVTSEGVTGPEALPMLDSVSSYQPTAVNSSGVIVGLTNRSGAYSAFIYSDDLQMQALPDLDKAVKSYAWDINDSGIVVGSVASEAVVWVNAQDKPTVLPLPAGYTSGSAGSINSEGLILGRATGSEVLPIGLIWVIHNRGQLEGPYQLAAGFRPAALNAEGDIVGVYGECGSALMRGDQLIILDPDESCHRPNDVTDAAADGTVRIVSGARFEGAVLWTVDAGGQVSGPVDLPNPKGTTGAYSAKINHQGWIVGAWRTERGDVPALWMPKNAEGDGDGD